MQIQESISPSGQESLPEHCCGQSVCPPVSRRTQSIQLEFNSAATLKFSNGDLVNLIGAQSETRTRTSVRTRRPERRASTNSATWAFHKPIRFLTCVSIPPSHRVQCSTAGWRTVLKAAIACQLPISTHFERSFITCHASPVKPVIRRRRKP